MKKITIGLKYKESKTPHFKVLPKIHKGVRQEGQLSAPLNSNVTKISEFIDHHLQPNVVE